MSWGDGASDCGTLTIRPGSRSSKVSTAEPLRRGGVERWVWWGEGPRRAVGSWGIGPGLGRVLDCFF